MDADARVHAAAVLVHRAARSARLIGGAVHGALLLPLVDVEAARHAGAQVARAALHPLIGATSWSAERLRRGSRRRCGAAARARALRTAPCLLFIHQGHDRVERDRRRRHKVAFGLVLEKVLDARVVVRLELSRRVGVRLELLALRQGGPQVLDVQKESERDSCAGFPRLSRSSMFRRRDLK